MEIGQELSTKVWTLARQRRQAGILSFLPARSGYQTQLLNKVETVPGTYMWESLASDLGFWGTTTQDHNTAVFNKGGEGFLRCANASNVAGSFAFSMWPLPLSLRHKDSSDAWEIECPTGEIEEILAKWVVKGSDRALYRKGVKQIALLYNKND